MQYNVNNPSVKRILREVREMDAEPSDQYTAHPLEDNIFEWHFTIRGPKDTEFEGGLYHGRIILPPEYPFKPPNIVLLNQSGRFEVGTKICLSISSYHPEHWQPSWSIRTVLVALISFMPTKGDGAIGALDMPPEDRKVLAKKTPQFYCDKCNKKLCDILSPEEPKTETTATTTITEPVLLPPTPTETSTTTTTTTTTTYSTTTPTPSSSSASITPQIPTNVHSFTHPSPTPQPPAQHAPAVHFNSFYTPPPQPVQAPPPPHTPLPPAPANTNANVNHNFNNNVNNVNTSTSNLDYMIMAILFAILGLLAKKFYGM